MIILVYILLIVIFGVCLLNTIAPKWCWRVFESWKANKEPSKIYFMSRRITGIIGMVIVIMLVLIPTLIAYYNGYFAK